ncbi:MAG: alpha 1 type collagen, partial [Myxococcaceae bacterium]|nr:alpha 1 type collagen [Myxococcaceae bacterium]
EHSMPMGEMRKQADKLKKGELDVLQLPRFRAGFRQIATDINQGIQRVVEKGGGTARKPADLESILGPVPAQPSMSAFSFPMNDPSAPPQTSPNMGGSFNQPAQASSQSGANNRFPGGPPPPQSAPSRPGAPPPPAASRPGGGPGVPMGGPGGMQHPGGVQQTFPGNERTMAMAGAPGGAPFPGNSPGNANTQLGGHGGPGSHSATVAASPGAQKLGMQATMPAPFPPPTSGSGATPKLAKDEDEQTMVAQPSADLIAATGGHNAATDPAAEWHQVYEEFLRTKRECNEPTDGLTFEKFQQTLKKNRDALMQRHGCKRVKFSVYVKEGRASLKATPVRD